MLSIKDFINKSIYLAFGECEILYPWGTYTVSKDDSITVVATLTDPLTYLYFTPDGRLDCIDDSEEWDHYTEVTKPQPSTTDIKWELI